MYKINFKGINCLNKTPGRHSKKCSLVLFFVIITYFLGTNCYSEVRWKIDNRVDLKSPPKDVVVSPGSKNIYILTGNGTILIYSLDGRLLETIETEKQVDQLKAGANNNSLLLINREKKYVETLTLDFIQKINTAGAPFKGKADAPIVITVFSEFQ